MPDPQAGHNTGDSRPARSKRSRKRFAYHECFHQDAWNGILQLTPEQVGVYWRIILLIYINRAALSDADDVETARACHTPTKTFKRIKRELIARGRLEYDEDNRVYWDKRAVEELTRLGFFSEAQTERALKRWSQTGSKPRTKKPVSSLESPKVLDVFSPGSQSQIEENQTPKSLTTHANQYPIPNESSSTESSTAQSEQAPPPSPLIGGGGALKAQRQGDGKPSDKRAATRAVFDAGAFAQRATTIVEPETEGEGAKP